MRFLPEDDPDLAPRERSQTENAAAPAAERPPPPPPPVFPEFLPAKIECSVLRFKHGTWTLCRLCRLGVKKGWKW